MWTDKGLQSLSRIILYVPLWISHQYNIVQGPQIELRFEAMDGVLLSIDLFNCSLQWKLFISGDV